MMNSGTGRRPSGIDLSDAGCPDNPQCEKPAVGKYSKHICRVTIHCPDGWFHHSALSVVRVCHWEIPQNMNCYAALEMARPLRPVP